MPGIGPVSSRQLDAACLLRLTRDRQRDTTDDGDVKGRWGHPTSSLKKERHSEETLKSTCEENLAVISVNEPLKN